MQVMSDGEHWVRALELTRNRLLIDGDGVEAHMNARAEALTNEQSETLDCSLVLVSIGYRSVEMNGLPFDKKRNVLPTGE